jgi:glycosyltransferase involved in cell wall biosynthesis
MNILFLTGSFYPQIGGVEKSVFCVSRELCRKGHNVSIITQKLDESVNQEFFKEGFTVYRIPPSIIPKTGTFWKWVWLLFHFKLIWKADIIHFHDFDVLIKWFLPFRFLFFRKKYYITFHGYEGFPLRYRYILFRKLSEELTHGNICVGEFIKRWYRTKPDIIYYAAVDVNNTTEVSSAEDYILFIGRLEKDTEVMNYLESLKLYYSATHNRTILKIVGDGSLKSKALDFLNKNNIPYEFCGFQQEPEKYIKRAKVVLTSSYLSIAESLAFGKIIIAFYSNNLKRDYLKCFPENDSLFFIMDDFNKTAKKIESIISQPGDFEEMSIAGMEYAKELSWSKVADKYISLYNKHNNEN